METIERTTTKRYSLMDNPRTKVLLSQFIITKVQETEVKDKIPSSKLIEDLLIEELNKKPFNASDRNPDNNARNVDLIMYALDHLTEFFRYKMFNSLDNKDIRAAANHFKHAHYKKGQYIFRYHEGSDKFYGLITGRVGIRGIKCTINADFLTYNKTSNPELENILYQEGIMNDKRLQQLLITDDSFIEYHFGTRLPNYLNENNLRYELEFEKVVFSSGMCLGEWGIIDNVPRTASIFCKEDTDVFYCEKDAFMKHLSMCFLRSTVGKRLFLNQMLPGLAKFFSNIVPLFFHKNNLIYSQFDFADYLYIVYQGECSYVHLENHKSAEDILLRKNEWKILYIIEKGSILGLESLQYNKSTQKNISSMPQPITLTRKCYQYNLIASKDFTVVYRISINLLTALGYDYKEYLKNVYMIHDKRLSLAEEKIEKMKVKSNSFHQKTILSNNDVNQCASLALEKVTRQAQREIQNKNRKRLKTFMIFSSDTQRSNNNTNKVVNNEKQHLLTWKKSFRRISAINPRIKTIGSSIKAMKISNASNLDYNLLCTRTSSTGNQKKAIKDKRGKSLNTNNSVSPSNTNYQSELLLTLQNLTSNVPKYNVKKIVQFPLSEPRKTKCFNIRHKFILDERERMKSKSLSKMNKEHTYYNSGFFEIPLITEILNNSGKMI